MFCSSLTVVFSFLIEIVRWLGDTISIVGSRRDRCLEHADNSRVSPPAGTEKRKPGGAQCTRDAKLSNLVSLRDAVHHEAIHPRSMCSEHSGMHTYTRLTDLGRHPPLSIYLFPPSFPKARKPLPYAGAARTESRLASQRAPESVVYARL
jgi:hypothetical protein